MPETLTITKDGIELQQGMQVIATEVAYYDSGNYSQQPGDILMVNGWYKCGTVLGAGITGTAYNGRKCIGLGTWFDAGTWRIATPDDPGYLATKEQWHAHKNAEIKRLRIKMRGYATLSLGLLALIAGWGWP